MAICVSQAVQSKPDSFMKQTALLGTAATGCVQQTALLRVRQHGDHCCLTGNALQSGPMHLHKGIICLHQVNTTK